MDKNKKLSDKQVTKLIKEHYWAASEKEKIGDELMRKVDGYFQSLDSSGQYYRLQASYSCLLYTSPSPRDRQKSRMPSSA